MIEIQSIANSELLRESVDLECKRAGGRDGRGCFAIYTHLAYLRKLRVLMS
mgnify:CR=1 FL=1